MSELEVLHEEIETLKKELARAEGTKDHLLKQLQTEHGTKNLEEVKRLLAVKKQEVEKLKAHYEESLKEYQRDRQQRLEGTKD